MLLIRSVKPALVSLAVILTLLPGCKSSQPTAVKEISQSIPTGDHPKFCAAIQGNGQAIFGHFHSLAHIISYYGMFDAAAGSSSATLTMFLLESILQNPAITDCNCSKDEKNQRIALMLKSLVGFFELNKHRIESTSLYSYSALLQNLEKKGLGDNPQFPIPNLTSADFQDLEQLLGVLYNKKFGQLIATSPNRNYHLNDYKASLTSGAFKVDSAKAFLRPFPVTFEGVATAVGWIGNFYAARGYTNSTHWNDWFATCQPNALKDKTWGQIAYQNYDPEHLNAFFADGNERTATACLEKFKVLISDYDAMDKKKIPSQNRVDEPVGKYLKTISATGLIIGDGVKKIEQAKADYAAAKEVTDLKIDYDQEFRVGYFGPKDLLDYASDKVAAEKAAGEMDVKTEKFFPIVGKIWRDVLQTSPAEPTISEAIPVEPNKVTSIGGWADPFPPTILKLAGCEHVFFITTERESFNLITGLNNLLGAEHSATGPSFLQSALSRGIADADAIWCTNWNNYTDYLSIPNVYDLSDKTFTTGFYTKQGSGGGASPNFYESLVVPNPETPRYGCSPVSPH